MLYKLNEWSKLLQGKQILIAGYGREGRSTESFFSKLLPKERISVADGNEQICSMAKDYDLIVKSPGIPSAVLDGCCKKESITSQTDLFLQIYGAQTVGITGTKGKSTTTELIYSMLMRGLPSVADPSFANLQDNLPSATKCNVFKAGNMGIPLFDIIPMLNKSSIIVAELSCHQLEYLHRAPHISVILNLFQEHLDHYPSYLDYQLAKLNIALKQEPNDYFFYCADNQTLRDLVEQHRGDIRSNITPYYNLENLYTNLSDSLQGDHNRSNVIVASKVAKLLGIDKQVTEAVAKSFKGLHHRMERIGTFNGITFYNDSISTIPEATMAAIDALKSVETVILGGYDRGIDYMGLAAFLVQSPLRNMVFVGKAGRRIYKHYANLVANSHDTRKCFVCDDYEQIVDWCFSNTTKGKSCLLSPAAASYDMFKNFEQRGDRFEQLVREHKVQ